jgi:hypothetical protein
VIIRRAPFEPEGAGGFRAARDEDDEADYRGRAERLLGEANAIEDVTARTELVIKAAILHHLALLREAGREIAPLPLRESPSFAKSRLEAQILGQQSERRGLRGGPETLERAREAYDASDAAPEISRRPAPRRKL